MQTLRKLNSKFAIWSANFETSCVLTAFSMVFPRGMVGSYDYFGGCLLVFCRRKGARSIEYLWVRFCSCWRWPLVSFNRQHISSVLIVNIFADTNIYNAAK